MKIITRRGNKPIYEVFWYWVEGKDTTLLREHDIFNRWSPAWHAAHQNFISLQKELWGANNSNVTKAIFRKKRIKNEDGQVFEVWRAVVSHKHNGRWQRIEAIITSDKPVQETPRLTKRQRKLLAE